MRYRSLHYLSRRLWGLCSCRASVVPGRTRCAECMAKHREAAHRRYYRRKHKRVCVFCEVTPLRSEVMCQVHLHLMREYNHRKTKGYGARRYVEPSGMFWIV